MDGIEGTHVESVVDENLGCPADISAAEVGNLLIEPWVTGMSTVLKKTTFKRRHQDLQLVDNTLEADDCKQTTSNGSSTDQPQNNETEQALGVVDGCGGNVLRKWVGELPCRGGL